MFRTPRVKIPKLTTYIKFVHRNNNPKIHTRKYLHNQKTYGIVGIGHRLDR